MKRGIAQHITTSLKEKHFLTSSSEHPISIVERLYGSTSHFLPFFLTQVLLIKQTGDILMGCLPQLIISYLSSPRRDMSMFTCSITLPGHYVREEEFNSQQVSDTTVPNSLILLAWQKWEPGEFEPHNFVMHTLLSVTGTPLASDEPCESRCDDSLTQFPAVTSLPPFIGNVFGEYES